MIIYICVCDIQYPVWKYTHKGFPPTPSHPMLPPLPAPLRTAPAWVGVGWRNPLWVYSHVGYRTLHTCLKLYIHIQIADIYVYIYIYIYLCEYEYSRCAIRLPKSDDYKQNTKSRSAKRSLSGESHIEGKNISHH